MSTANTNNNNDGVRVPPRFGACVDDMTDVERCALAPSSCGNGETYRPAYSTLRVCLEKDVFLGQCAANQRCAPSKDACEDDVAFQELPNGHCTLKKDTINHNGAGTAALAATAFPSCKDDENRCVIDASYCRPGENLFPQAGLHDSHDCLCQDVTVGLCFEKGLTTDTITVDNSFCAAHSLDCPFETHRFLDGYHLSLFDCRLCDPTTNDDDLLVGACVEKDTNLTHSGTINKCAKTASECPSTTTFLSQSELLEQHGLYCPAAKPTPFPTLRPTNSPTKAPNQPTTSSASGAKTQNNEDPMGMFVPESADEPQQLSSVGVYWIVIAAVAALVLMISVVTGICWRSKKQRALAAQKAVDDTDQGEDYSTDGVSLPAIE